MDWQKASADLAGSLYMFSCCYLFCRAVSFAQSRFDANKINSFVYQKSPTLLRWS